MTDWFEEDVDLADSDAAAIAAGMRLVAKADGVVHEREMNIIASFESELPAGQEAQEGELSSAGAKRAYLRSLAMVALADGVLSEAELVVIRKLGSDQGFNPEEIATTVTEVKRRFLAVFAGVQVFRDSVVRVATDLGLPPSEVDSLRGEA